MAPLRKEINLLSDSAELLGFGSFFVAVLEISVGSEVWRVLRDVLSLCSSGMGEEVTDFKEGASKDRAPQKGVVLGTMGIGLGILGRGRDSSFSLGCEEIFTGEGLILDKVVTDISL